jgi:hypothetical protein
MIEDGLNPVKVRSITPHSHHGWGDLHLGSFLSVIVSFKLCERPEYSPAGVTGVM